MCDVMCPRPSWCRRDHGRLATQPLPTTAPAPAGLRCSLAINHQRPALCCRGNCANWGEKKTFAIPELIYTGRYFTCQLGQPNIKFTPCLNIFCYVFSFSVANSFYKTPWDCSWSTVWLQSTQAEPGRRQQLEANQQEGAPREAGVGRYSLQAAGREIVFTILPACCK